MMTDDRDRPPITAQQYEILHGGGAEAAEISKHRLSRRRFLRRSILAIWGVSATAAIGGGLEMLYPNLVGQFGGVFTVGKKTKMSAAVPGHFQLGQAGVFYFVTAKTSMIHLAKETPWLLQGTNVTDQWSFEWITPDRDGTWWIALYQRCVHLGCTVPFRHDCQSFKCPYHGSHYHLTGEYLDRPAPRSLDRFAFSFSGDDVMVDTGTLNQHVPHPDATTRLIAVPKVACRAT